MNREWEWERTFYCRCSSSSFVCSAGRVASSRSGSQSQRGLPFTLRVLINQISAIFVITIDWPVLRVLYPLTCRLHGKVAMEFKLPVLTARLFVAHTPGRAGMWGVRGVSFVFWASLGASTHGHLCLGLVASKECNEVCTVTGHV